MKIEKIQTFVVGNPPPHTGGRYFIFVKLTTDTGVTGIGEIYTATYSPQIVCKVAEDMFERYVFGTDPFHIEKMWRRTYGSA